MIEKGLASSDPKLRDSFASVIGFIVQSIKSPDIPEPPLLFFTRLLLSKLEYVQQKGMSRYTNHYFNVLKELLPQYFDAQQADQLKDFKGKEIFDPSILIKDVVR